MKLIPFKTSGDKTTVYVNADRVAWICGEHDMTTGKMSNTNIWFSAISDENVEDFITVQGSVTETALELRG